MAAVALLLASAPSAAQSVRGQLVDASGSPVTQVLVVLLDDAGKQVAGGFSGQGGAFAVRAPRAGRYRLRAERVGYATALTQPFQLAAGQTAQQRLVLTPRPDALSGLVATAGARRCQVRPGSGTQTADTWEEARKALNSAAYGQSQQLFRYRVERWERDLAPADQRVLRETRRDTAALAQHPFASPPAAELSAKGWVQATAEGRTFYGPDPAVLVSDEFLDDHCLRMVDGARGDSLVGVAFQPVGGRRLPDIRGTLWLSRATSELRRVDYTYTGLPDNVSHPRLGGTVEYARLADGPWIVTRWSIRMPQVELQQGQRTTPGREGVYTAYENARLVAIHENGGQVLSTTAGNGATTASAADLAAIDGVVWDSLRAAPVAGARVFVSGTAFEAVTDSAGRFHVEGLRGGTYTVGFSAGRLGPAAAAVKPVSVTVAPGSTATAALAVPGLAAVASAACPDLGAQPNRGVVLGTVRGGAGAAAGATVRATWSAAGAGAARVAAGYVATTTDETGGFALCGVPEGQSVLLSSATTTGGVREQVRLASGTPAQVGLVLGPGGAVAAAQASPGGAVALRRVTATARRSMADFQRRRASGRGIFLTREQILAKNAHSTADVFMGLPGIAVIGNGRGGQKVQMTGAIVSDIFTENIDHNRPENVLNGDQRLGAPQHPRSGSSPDETQQAPNSIVGRAKGQPISERAGMGDCQVQYYVDGALFYPTVEGDISADIPVSQIQAIEIYRNLAETPVEFRGNNFAGCGTVVIWTVNADR
jgi:hypothetical protein